jgi:hypothetical protein
MDVTAKYELIGLMAYPIRHSLSPEMQNKALEKAGLPFTYMAFEVDNDSFPGAIEGLKALKMRGTGVSMPNKQLACEYVDELTPAAKVTSIYMMMGGLANFVIPLITGYLSNIGLQYIIVLDFTFALLALITAIIVFIRYYRVFIIPENDVRFGERKFCTRLNTIKHRG